MDISYRVRSVVGPVRKDNQDHYLVADGRGRQDPGQRGGGAVDDGGGWALLAVADGMGGEKGGRTAAELALDALHSAVASGKGPVAERLKAGVRRASRAVYDKAEGNAELEGMGTTLTGCVAAGGVLTLGHAGDSRAYLWRAGALARLTTDHSFLEKVLKLDEESARNHPRRNVLAQCVGGSEPDVCVELSRVRLRPGDRLLLSSDGMHGVVPEAELSRLMAEPDLDRACGALLDAALKNDTKDNVTVLLAGFGEAAAGAGAEPARLEKLVEVEWAEDHLVEKQAGPLDDPPAARVKAGPDAPAAPAAAGPAASGPARLGWPVYGAILGVLVILAALVANSLRKPGRRPSAPAVTVGSTAPARTVPAGEPRTGHGQRPRTEPGREPRLEPGKEPPAGKGKPKPGETGLRLKPPPERAGGPAPKAGTVPPSGPPAPKAPGELRPSRPALPGQPGGQEPSEEPIEAIQPPEEPAPAPPSPTAPKAPPKAPAAAPKPADEPAAPAEAPGSRPSAISFRSRDSLDPTQVLHCYGMPAKARKVAIKSADKRIDGVELSPLGQGTWANDLKLPPGAYEWTCVCDGKEVKNVVYGLEVK